MNNMINLKDLYKCQADLDKEIAEKHNVTYETTISKRQLALIVEIGELANETRCMKFWSNKGPSPKEIIMDEYADGLHFLLSLGIALGVDKMEYEIVPQETDLVEQFHQIYSNAIDLHLNFNKNNYIKCFQSYLNITPSLQMSEQDIFNCYKAKLSVNYKRQENNY